MSTLPTPPTTPTLRAATPGATPPPSLTSSQASTTAATPPQSPTSQLTPASTNTSIATRATNATNATNAPPGTTSTAAATEKSKSPSVFSSIASSIFSTVSSIFTYLGKVKEKFKKKVEKFVGFFVQRGLTDEERAALCPTAKDEQDEIERRAKAIEEVRAGDHLNTLAQIRKDAAFAKQEVNMLRDRVNAYDKKASEERQKAFDAMRD